MLSSPGTTATSKISGEQKTYTTNTTDNQLHVQGSQHEVDSVHLDIGEFPLISWSSETHTTAQLTITHKAQRVYGSIEITQSRNIHLNLARYQRMRGS